MKIIVANVDKCYECLESVINTVGVPLIILDKDLRVVTANPSFYKLFKVKLEETVGQFIYDLGNKQWDIPELRELLENVLHKKTSFDNYEIERDFASIGKRVLLLNARQIPIMQGKEKAVLLTIEDITELKTCNVNETKYRSLLDDANDAIFMMSGDVFTYCNDSTLKMFGVKREEIIGQPPYRFSPPFQPDGRDSKEKALEKINAALSGQPQLFEWKHSKLDGTTFDAEVSLNLIKIENQIGIQAIVRDISERKLAEANLEASYKKLENLAAELKRTSYAKSEFLASMSHELRTPLNSINGFSEILYDETFGPLNAKQKTYVNNVLTSSQQLLLLINQMLDTAKIESGKMTLELSNLPMKRILSDASTLMTDAINKKKIEMSLEIAEDLPDIQGDETRIKEILYHLLSNAIKFTPEGGKIGLRAKKVDSEIEVVIWDTGIGIAPENVGKLFESFSKIERPAKISEGPGLGLSLTKKLVEMHGGKISLESGPNKGTQIRLTLPIVSRKGEKDEKEKS